MSGRKGAQIFASIAANLCQHAVGHCVSMSAWILPQLQDNSENEDGLVLTESEGSWFASMFVVGCLTGSLVGGYQCDYLGRKKSMLLDSLLMIIGFISISIAPNFETLIIGRLVTGHAGGSNLVSSPIFVSEISHPDIRGTSSVLTMVLCTSGFFISMLAGAALNWRLASGLFVITGVLSFILLLFCKESPTWLLRKKTEDTAMEALFFYRGDTDVCKKELERIKKNIESLKPLKKQSRVDEYKSTLKRLRSKEFLKPFLFLNLILNFGLEWAGFPAMAFYMHTVIKQMEIPLNEYWVAVGLAGYRSCLTIGLSFILYKARRRPLYLLSGSLVCLATASLSAYNWIAPSLDPSIKESISFLPLVSVILMYTGFGLGYGPIVYMLQGELLPSDMRSLGCGLLGVLDNISLFIAVKTVPTLISYLGIHGAFMSYSACILTNLIICAFVMPETKGLSLEEIEDFYKKRERKVSITC